MTALSARHMLAVGVIFAAASAAVTWFRRTKRSRAHEDEDMADWPTKLAEDHQRLSERLNGFRIYLRHGIPDSALFHYGLDVLEQCHAVTVISTTDLARASMTNARSAYEAALYMLALTSSEAEYDQNGALAQACQLVEIEQLHSRRAKADVALGLPRIPGGLTPEQAMEADGSRWEEEFQGAKAMCLVALATVRGDKRWKRHWTGDSGWKDVAARVATAWNAEEGFVEMADAIYGAESYQSHPRPRAGARSQQWDKQGRLVAQPKDNDGPMAAALAWVACKFAIAALTRRGDFRNAVNAA